METVIFLVLAFVVIVVAYALLGKLLAKFPFLIWIISIACGIAVGASTYWWLGVLAGFFMVGILAHAESFGGRKCSNCGSYDTKVIDERDGYEIWHCNKCYCKTIGNKR